MASSYGSTYFETKICGFLILYSHLICEIILPTIYFTKIYVLKRSEERLIYVE